MPAKVKVVFSGRDAITDRMFTIVKMGVYTLTMEGCIAALRDGIYDKYHREAPEFKCLIFDKVETYSVDAKTYEVFVFCCVEYATDSSMTCTIISGKVTFSYIA